MNFLRGKRTYLVAVLMFAIQGLTAAGILTKEQADAILTLLASIGLITLRAALGGK